MDEPSAVVISADRAVIVDDGYEYCEFNIPLDEDKCGQDGTKATMGIVVKNNRLPKKKILLTAFEAVKNRCISTIMSVVGLFVLRSTINAIVCRVVYV